MAALLSPQFDTLTVVNDAILPFKLPRTRAVSRLLSTRLAEMWVSVGDFGAKGDNVTDDTQAIRDAVAAVQAVGSGTVYMPPTGAPYVISGTIFLPNGVTLIGVEAQNFNGMDASVAQWSASGTWIRPTHATSAICLLGHGASIRDICFIHNQPIPDTVFAPNTYGYCIECNANFSYIKGIKIVNASHGVLINYSTGSGGGTNLRIENCIISTFAIGLRTSFVNDTMTMKNVHFRGLYYIGNAVVQAYVQTHNTNWYCGYTDNPMITNVEFAFCGTAMYFFNETCLGNTHSFYQGLMSNVQFGLSQVAMKVAASTTVVVGQFNNMLAQAGNNFGVQWADTMFQLGSDFVDLVFSNVRIPVTGGKVAQLGAGVGGRLTLVGCNIDSYSAVSPYGQEAFALAAGAQLRLSGTCIGKFGPQAGPRFAGAGVENVVTDAYGAVMFFGRWSEQSVAANGTWQDFSTDCILRPGQMRVHQVRLVGTFIVSVAVAASTFSARLNGTLASTPVVVSGLSSAAAGQVSADSGWVDIADADLAALSIFGRLQVNGAAGVTLQSGSVQLLYR